MQSSTKKGLQTLVWFLIPLIMLNLSALSIGDSKELYANLNLPPLAPPNLVFMIVWPALYLLMSVSACLIFRREGKESQQALFVFGLLLAALFIWPFCFFRIQFFTFSAFLIAVIILLGISVFYNFKSIRPLAAYLLIPLLIWVVFALYLNLGIIVLN